MKRRYSALLLILALLLGCLGGCASDKAAVTESFAQLIAQGVYGEDLYADL